MKLIEFFGLAVTLLAGLYGLYAIFYYEPVSYLLPLYVLGTVGCLAYFTRNVISLIQKK